MQEVLKFFEQLTTCMGENIEFNVGNFCEGAEGDRFTVVVNWHLGMSSPNSHQYNIYAFEQLENNSHHYNIYAFEQLI